jgi:integrase
MPLSIRRRGTFFHVRGTIRVGQETRIVKECSTGCDRKEDADAYRARLEAEIRRELLYGTGGRAVTMMIADAGLAYINRPGGLHRNDLWRLDQINDLVGDVPIIKARAAWAEFMAKRCVGLKPATVDRIRSVLQAAINHAAELHDFEAPRVARTYAVENKRIRFLSVDQQNRLLASYAKHVQPIAATLCFQGMRIGEALKLEWQYVNWQADTLYFPRTKNGEPRTNSIHARVRPFLHRMWVGQGNPGEGRVFLNRLGEPYSDPDEYKIQGGNPISKAHRTACARAGINDFRVHDWRHHWASWCVMSGIDLETIRQEGGWKSLRMVEKYAAVNAEHRKDVLQKRK